MELHDEIVAWLRAEDEDEEDDDEGADGHMDERIGSRRMAKNLTIASVSKIRH